jgi:AraC-like DNA-binding protein
MNALDKEKLNLIAAFALLVIAILVTFRRKKNEPPVTFLSLYFWCFFYTMMAAYLVTFKHVVAWPHLFRTGVGASLLMMPASYLYIRQSLFPRKFKTLDLLHLLPFVLYLANYSTFFFLSGEEKIRIIQASSEQELTIGFSDGLFLPKYGLSVIRYVQVALYFLLQWRLITLVQRSREHPVVFGNPQSLSWMKVLVVSQPLLFLSPLVAVLVGGEMVYGSFATLGGVAVALWQGYYLFSHPEMLYGFPALAQHEMHMQDPIDQPSLLPEPRESSYTEEMLDEADRVLEAYMVSDKPYLKGRFKLHDLSAATGLSGHLISAYVNRRKGVNFFGYLNQYRVQECLTRIGMGDHRVKTLEALAEECGFQSRVTFIRVFKQVTGKTPSEYIDSLG